MSKSDGTTTDPRPAASGDPDDRLVEHRLDGARVYGGALLDVRRDRVRLPDGGEAVREYIVHPGAVLIIPILDDRRFVVERQYRYPPNRAFLEFPAGKLDAGEHPLDTARRELAEEAGYTAIEWTRLGVVHPVISYSTESIVLYAARGMTHVGASLDDGEFLELLQLSEADLYQAIDDERLSDAKSVAALALWSRWVAAPTRHCTVRITGDVQRIGYREWMRRQASELDVGGWVRNRADGTVEASVSGQSVGCDELITRCRRGPRGAAVGTIDIHRAPRADSTDSIKGFEIRASA